MKLDVYNHIVPKPVYDRMQQLAPNKGGMHKRVTSVPMMIDLDERFRVMDRFPGYSQILSLSSPPLDTYGPPAVAGELARMANDCMAELAGKYPERFPGFIAELPLNDPAGLLKEAERAVKQLGAVGVQVYTNVQGRPITDSGTAPLFDLMAKLDLPLWMHPARGPLSHPDYQGDKKQLYEIWWTFGWPYETSVAMAHMVFTGLFDRHPDIKIITHHMGGMIPYFEGRVGPGWDQLGKRDEEYANKLAEMKKRPLDYFKMFYADTAVFGAVGATKCGLEFFGADHVLFASDAPFDPEKGSAYIRWTIDIIDRLDLAPAERHAIYEGNARKLLRLKERQAA